MDNNSNNQLEELTPVSDDIVYAMPSVETAAIEPLPRTIPWLKIAALGLGVQLAIGLVWLLTLSAGFYPIVFISILFRGLDNLHSALFFLSIPIALALLRSWSVKYPAVIAVSSMLTLFGLHRISEKLPISGEFALGLAGYQPTLLETVAPLVLFIASLIAGALVFLLATLLTNKIRHKIISMGILFVVILGVHASASALQESSAKFESTPKVKDLGWKLLPTSLPTWLKEQGQNYDETCAGQNAYAGYYICKYYFVNYPGYLSHESQAIIAQARQPVMATTDAHYPPSPFYWVEVVRDDNKNLAPYKYRNGRCDWNGLNVAGSNLRHRDGSLAQGEAANPRRCVAVDTPGGKKLYYDSHLNYGQYTLQVPNAFYFEQGDSIVMINLNYNGAIVKNSVTEAYFTDVSFKTELYKFVDSFN